MASASTKTANKTATVKQKISGKTAPSIVMENESAYDVEERLDYIATAAYFRAASRGFMPGGELHDWLEAETEFQDKGGH